METPSIRTWVLPGYPLNINNNNNNRLEWALFHSRRQLYLTPFSDTHTTHTHTHTHTQKRISMVQLSSDKILNAKGEWRMRQGQRVMMRECTHLTNLSVDDASTFAWSVRRSTWCDQVGCVGDAFSYVSSNFLRQYTPCHTCHTDMASLRCVSSHGSPGC